MPKDSPTPRTVLISGASTGIGRACALHLGRLGWRVFAGVRRDADGDSVVAEAHGMTANVRAVRLDVTDTASVAAAVDQVREAAGDDGLAALVNNAGIAVGGPVEFIPLADWRRQFEVNLFGQIAVTQAALPLLRAHVKARGKGAARVVMMSSVAGRVAVPVAAPYSASKFALEAVSDSLRLELRPQGIFVCLVEPGAIDTPIWKKEEESAAGVPSEARALYGPAIDAFEAGARKSARNAIPPKHVCDAVMRCLMAPRPRIRTVVGLDAKLGAWFKGRVPDQWFDAALVRAMGFPR